MLISPEYAALNAELHRTRAEYGWYGGNAEKIAWYSERIGTRDILDYGCGKGNLARRMPWPIKEYDPGIPGKDAPPQPADMVICRDVLEHVEPDCLHAVLADLARCVKRVGFFAIGTGPSWDILADGRNAHVLQRSFAWWKTILLRYFRIEHMQEVGQISGKGYRMFIGGSVVYFTVTPKRGNTNGRR